MAKFRQIWPQLILEKVQFKSCRKKPEHSDKKLQNGMRDDSFIRTNVTRFGEISPLWHNVKKLWPF